MKILILGLNFSPELIGVGKYTGDFAAWLRAQGHAVRVVTAPPYYPSWQVNPGYRASAYDSERDGHMRITRCPIWVPAQPSPLRRIAHLCSFALTSVPPMIWHAIRWRPDVVWTVEPTAFAIPSALLASRLAGAKACLHVQDLEIEAAFTLHMLQRAWLWRPVRAAYRCCLRRFDLISTISERMRSQLVRLGAPAHRLVQFPNWIDAEAIRPLPAPVPLRRRLGFSDEQVIALYAGNMGEKQGVESLAEVAAQLADQPQLRLVLCGDGAVRHKLEAMVKTLPNITLLPLQPQDRFNELLNLADIHLLPQRAGTSLFALPSKFGGMLASGRPVVAQAEDGELAEAARGCGIVVPPGDTAAMAAAILTLAAQRERRQELGQAARRYAATHLARDRILERYTGQLERLSAPPLPRPSWWQRLGSLIHLPRPAGLPLSTPLTLLGRRR